MRITVELEENPSTGYRWEPTIPPAADEFVCNAAPGDFRVGAGGVRKMVFDNPPHTLTINKCRAWETDTPPIEVVTILHHSRR